MSIEQGFSHEAIETTKGRNIKIHNYWIRHTQKASGEVFNQAGTGISASNISPGGAERARAKGQTFVANKDGAKGYRSESARTLETFENLMKGYQESNPQSPVREKVVVREELLSSSGPQEWTDEYNEKWSANKNRLLQEGISQNKYPNVTFNKLTPDQQEEIAEAAEEPVIQEWIDNPESSLAKNFPPRIQAAKFATLFNRRHERMVKFLNSGSEIDLFHNTHKTATEAFLASGVLIRKADGKKITKIADIGGSLKILDQWESELTTDESGQPTVRIFIRGEEFSIDKVELEKLAQEGLSEKYK